MFAQHKKDRKIGVFILKINRDPDRKTSLQWIKAGRIVNADASGEECKC